MVERGKSERGLTAVTVLLLLAVAGGIYWIIAFGEAYWDNFEVAGILNQAANLSYREHDDSKVKQFIAMRLHELFDFDALDSVGRPIKLMRIDYDANDLRIERTQIPARVHIWLTYTRKVKLPLLGDERALTFTKHAEQDLSPVRW